MTPPEELHQCGVVVLVAGQIEVAHGTRLRSCPGLAVTKTPAGWVVVHDAFSVDGPPGTSSGGRSLTPGYAAPWAEAVRYMRALAAMEVDWMQPQPQVRRADMPPLGEGWVLAELVEPRRAA